MPKTRKIPMRKCVVCQEQVDKRQLFRVVRSPEGEVFLDSTGKKNGRGAYLSRKKECIDMARKKNMLSRHLGTAIPEHVFDEMLELLEESTSHAPVD
ncbi:MAG: YlxR family protein [Sporolactobacillus sp.]